MNFMALKNFFLRVMIACLTVSGLIAVITVLTGSFNETFGKALTTILFVAIHALLSFGYIDVRQKDKDPRDLTFFSNTTFILIILSFITSVFGLWEIISGDLVAKLYATYGVILFAVLHGETLSRTRGNEKMTDQIVSINYVFMIAVIGLILPIIYANDASFINDMYYRILAALGIVDAILTLIAIILNRIYLGKHPKAVDASRAGATDGSAKLSDTKKHSGLHVIGYIVGGLILLQLVGGLIVAIVGRQAATNVRETTQSQTDMGTAPNSTSDQYKIEDLYSYETEFDTIDYYSYNCIKPIKGVWKRTDISNQYFYYFTPEDKSLLAKTCSYVPIETELSPVQ